MDYRGLEYRPYLGALQLRVQVRRFKAAGHSPTSVPNPRLCRTHVCYAKSLYPRRFRDCTLARRLEALADAARIAALAPSCSSFCSFVGVYVCMYVFMYVSMYLCMYVCMYTYIHVSIFVCVCTYLCMYIYICVCVCVCTCVCVCSRARVCVCTCLLQVGERSSGSDDARV